MPLPLHLYVSLFLTAISRLSNASFSSSPLCCARSRFLVINDSIILEAGDCSQLGPRTTGPSRAARNAPGCRNPRTIDASVGDYVSRRLCGRSPSRHVTSVLVVIHRHRCMRRTLPNEQNEQRKLFGAMCLRGFLVITCTF